MRIRIIRSLPVRGIDGVRLKGFVVGQQYEVGNSLGAMLVRRHWAEPIDDLGPALVIPFTEMKNFRKEADARNKAADPRNLIRERTLPYFFDWSAVATAQPHRQRRPRKLPRR